MGKSSIFNTGVSIVHTSLILLTIVYYSYDYLFGFSLSSPWNELDNIEFDNNSSIYLNDKYMIINTNETTHKLKLHHGLDIRDKINHYSNMNIPIHVMENKSLSGYLFSICLVLSLGVVFRFTMSSVIWIYKIIKGDKTADSPLFSMTIDPLDKNVFQVTEETNFKLEDIIGLDECKEELQQIIDMLKNRNKFIEVGAEIPRGALLIGEPGTGKTFTAKAIAGECNMPFISCSGSDFIEIYQGSGTKRVRELFELANEKKPCIIFIDEIDSIGSRGNHSNREGVSTINKILTEMDGFMEKNNDIFVMAATNSYDMLDKALIRNGRFEYKIHFEYPNKNERKQLFEMYFKKKKLDKSFIHDQERNFETLSSGTYGMTGADIKSISQISAREFVRNLLKNNNKDISNIDIENENIGITMKEINNAIDEVKIGKKKSKNNVSDKEKNIIAYHELGHAFLSYSLIGCESPSKVSVIPRGLSLGVTVSDVSDDKLYTIDKLISRLIVLFGGQMAEYIFCDNCTSGASDDIKKAKEFVGKIFELFACIPNELLHKMKIEIEDDKYNFENKFGTICLDKKTDEISNTNYNNMNLIINYSRFMAHKLIDINKNHITNIHHILLEKEELSKDDLYEHWININDIYNIT